TVLHTTLVLIMKADQRHQMRRDFIIALVGKLVAIIDVLVVIRITSRIVHQSLPGTSVAVGAGDGYYLSVAVSIRIEETAADLCPLRVLLPLAGRPIANVLMKVRRGLVVQRGTYEQVLIFQRRIVGNVIKIPGVG